MFSGGRQAHADLQWAVSRALHRRARLPVATTTKHLIATSGIAPRPVSLDPKANTLSLSPTNARLVFPLTADDTLKGFRQSRRCRQKARGTRAPRASQTFFTAQQMEAMNWS